MSPSPIAIGVGNDTRPGALLLAPAQRQPPPAQHQPPGPGQAEFVICDQTIEAMFSDFKIRGFGLEDSRLQRPERLDRLILVMALALHWAVSTGMWDAVHHPTPDEKKPRIGDPGTSAAA
jgi:hypothetical protein